MLHKLNDMFFCQIPQTSIQLLRHHRLCLFFSGNNTRSGSHHKLVHPMATTNCFKHFYFNRLPYLWKNSSVGNKLHHHGLRFSGFTHWYQLKGKSDCLHANRNVAHRNLLSITRPFLPCPWYWKRSTLGLVESGLQDQVFFYVNWFIYCMGLSYVLLLYGSFLCTKFICVFFYIPSLLYIWVHLMYCSIHST